jgi:hypothetical protein
MNTDGHRSEMERDAPSGEWLVASGPRLSSPTGGGRVGAFAIIH